MSRHWGWYLLLVLWYTLFLGVPVAVGLLSAR